MKVWVYLEGKSDCKALSALWGDWTSVLRVNGWGIQTISLENKSKFFHKIGPRVAEKLLNDENDLVVGLPDLYPNRNYENTEFRHRNLRELKDLQRILVERELPARARPTEVQSCLSRFYPSALKYDLEMLLLATPSHLQSQLKMSTKPQGWRLPPEEQNQDNPPKRIVEQLFRTKLKRSYREISDCHTILNRADISEVLFDERGGEQCPSFRCMIDWIVEKTGVQAY